MPNKRVTKILYIEQLGLIAGDVSGCIQIYDPDSLDLKEIWSAFPTGESAFSRPIYALEHSNKWIVSRDKGGTISQWDIETRQIRCQLNPVNTKKSETVFEEEELSPSIVHGIGIKGNRVYTTNGYFQYVILDLDTFSIIDITDAGPLPGTKLECFNTMGPLDIVSNKSGQLAAGNLTNDSFPTVLKIDSGNIHKIVYDYRFNRYWVTLDTGFGDTKSNWNGIAIVPVDDMDIANVTYDKFARNDVEALVISKDCLRVFVGGFEGYIRVYDNTSKTLKCIEEINGFPHQITDMQIGNNDSLYALTQDGIITKVDTKNKKFVASSHYRRQCVWDFDFSISGGKSEEETTILAATDDGIWDISYNQEKNSFYHFKKIFDSQNNFIRRIVAAGESVYFSSWNKTVGKLNYDSASGIAEEIWVVNFNEIVHDISAFDDCIAVAHTSGFSILNSDMGTIEATIHVDKPVWAVKYLDTENLLIGTRTGHIYSYNLINKELKCTFIAGYIKRFNKSGDTLFATGGTGIRILSSADYSLISKFDELLDNTVENGLIVNKTKLVAVSYGLQVALFDIDTHELLGIDESLCDIPKAILQIDNGLILVGGRGGYIRCYRYNDKTELLDHTQDVWLPRVCVNY